MDETALMGYRRKDGFFGIRNYVLVISTVHCANAVAEQIAMAEDVACITHEHGCTEAEYIAERTVLGLARAGQSPNVFGVLLVGLGCEQIDREALLQEISLHTDYVESISIQACGGPPEAVAAGVQIVQRLKAAAALQQREPMPFSQLVVGVQCGGSDWTTALAGNAVIGEMTDCIVARGGSVLMGEVYGFPGSEHIVAEHAVNRQVGGQIMQMVRELRAEFIRKTGYPIEQVNPTPGNKAGGITTLVEKSMGNVKKMGSAPIQGILQVGQRPPHPGLWIVDSRNEGPDSFNITAFALSLAHAAVFSSGRGTPVGNAVMPVLKLTGNPKRFDLLQSLFDFNAGVVLQGAALGETGAALLETLLGKLNGGETRSEINWNREYTIPYGGVGRADEAV